jgi:hypothetical protein
MAEIVNLRTVKKRAARKAARAEADANAAKFGRTKAERALEGKQAEKAARDLDAHRRETD